MCFAAINEFTAPRWQVPYQYDPSQTLGHFILSNRGLFTCARPHAPEGARMQGADLLSLLHRVAYPSSQMVLRHCAEQARNTF